MNARQAPYLSVVVTSRNDDHGGDPLMRLQAFINCFDAQCCRTGLDAEVIIVEWNPPADRPRLQSLVRWPTPCVCTYRFVDVPPELHGTLQYSDVLPLFQMIAKNVGIRRARGRFVLATNIDILFANELVEHLASGQLQSGHLYRVDRHDIQAAVPVDAPLDAQMAYCAEHHLRIHARWGSYAVDGLGRALAMAEDIVDGRTVRLGSGWHVREGTASPGFYRWVTDSAFVHVDRSADPVLAGPAVFEIELQTNPYAPSSWIDIEIADESGGVLARHRVTRRRIWRLSLEEGGAPRTFELRVKAVPHESRRHLPVFERRGAMHYIVHSIRVTSVDEARTQPPFVYPGFHWRAMPGAAVTLDGSGAQTVTTNPPRYSYAAEYGPMRAPEAGVYRFAVTYDVADGDILVGVLDEKSRGWLTTVVDDVLTPRGRVATVAVPLASGATFSLMLSNNHDGDGVSRVAIKELTGSIDPGRVISVPRPSAPVRSRVAWLDRRRIKKKTVAEASLGFSLDGWRPANFDDLPELARSDEGLEVVSRGRPLSYCIEYGPLRAPVAGAYSFAIDYQLLEGDILAGLLSENRRRWLPTSPREAVSPGGRRTLVVRAALRSGQTCWLTLSNNHDAGGVSRFVVTDLRVSVDPSDLLSSLVAAARRLRLRTEWLGQSVTPVEHGAEYPPEAWRIGDRRDRTRAQLTADGLSVETDARRWSYALEAGPMQATARGRYDFALACDLAEGGIGLGVLDRDKTRWLPPSGAEAAVSDRQTLRVSVHLAKGQLFWLIVPNIHPAGNRPSRFVVRTMTSVVEPLTWRSACLRAISRWVRPTQSATPVEDGAEYPLESWRIGDGRDSTRIERRADGLAVETDARRWAYVLEAGPMRAAARGACQFQLTYDLEEGDIAMGVLHRDKARWLRSSSSSSSAAAGRRTLTTSVDLAKGQMCWLIVSNAHPQGDRPSRFVVRTLSSTVEPLTWRSACTRAITRWRRRLADRRDRGVARLRGGFSGLARRLSATPTGVPPGRVRRLVNGARALVVRTSPEYAAMRASFLALEQEHRTAVARVAQLSELAQLHQLLHDHRPDALHLNGCGDFQLMAREHWFELRGYPEFQTFSMNIDGLFSSIAYYAGITERPLESPHHIYHLEHEVGSGWSPEGEALLRRRIDERGITWLDARDVFVWSAYMHRLRRPMIFNTSDWGFGTLTLAESIVDPRLDPV